MRIGVVLMVVLLAETTARATPGADLEAQFRSLTDGPDSSLPSPRFAMYNLDVRTTDDELASAYIYLADINTHIERVIAAVSGDGRSAWLAADMRYLGDCGGDGNGCGKTLGTGHTTGLFERINNAWQPVVWNTAYNITATRHIAAVKHGKHLAAIPAKIDGAGEVVKLFQATIADPKALAASVSDRKDVLLYGSEEGERYLGTQVKAKLAAWKLVLRVHDGIRAGLTESGTVAWVAANLDAISTSKPRPYRALFIYERQQERWALVQAQFSFGGL